MKIILIKILMLIPTMINLLKTPMSMGVMLLIQTLMLTLMLSKMMESSWMAMITFLMFIGGLLILFMYMSSIASNEKFKFNYKIFMMTILLIIPTEELLTENQMADLLDVFYTKEMITLTKIYNKKTMMITIMMFVYMFLAMIVVTSIVKIYKGPLRSMK